ncbi:hypothetical protein Thal_0694 [Thermocrinis albus DSM 14484]|uniref:Uncharacterized protein n=1 Tax=Thermocrinis albus (strain DSM 14484 / JCM 11386 / HI 11/12) TaxID=638303 RepID=D3SQ90_THEAH|nr:hypothetical protein [Thermocrinis albus]ADC89327.1 hypothetical protein Thal_0694 [Thermocrinis albus DSM 14484]
MQQLWFFLKRLEEILNLQYKSVNIVLYAGGKFPFSPSAVLDILRYSSEAVDLLVELINALDLLDTEAEKKHVLGLAIDTMSCMEILIPSVESFSSLLMEQGFYEKTRELIDLLQEALLSMDEELLREVLNLMSGLSALLKYNLYIVSRYSNLMS